MTDEPAQSAPKPFAEGGELQIPPGAYGALTEAVKRGEWRLPEGTGLKAHPFDAWLRDHKQGLSVGDVVNPNRWVGVEPPVGTILALVASPAEVCWERTEDGWRDPGYVHEDLGALHITWEALASGSRPLMVASLPEPGPSDDET